MYLNAFQSIAMDVNTRCKASPLIHSDSRIPRTSESTIYQLTQEAIHHRLGHGARLGSNKSPTSQREIVMDDYLVVAEETGDLKTQNKKSVIL